MCQTLGEVGETALACISEAGFGDYRTHTTREHPSFTISSSVKWVTPQARAPPGACSAGLRTSKAQRQACGGRGAVSERDLAEAEDQAQLETNSEHWTDHCGGNHTGAQFWGVAPIRPGQRCWEDLLSVAGPGCWWPMWVRPAPPSSLSPVKRPAQSRFPIDPLHPAWPYKCSSVPRVRPEAAGLLSRS